MPPERSAPGAVDLVAGARELGLDLDPATLDRLDRYLALLQRWNQVYNLTAVRDPAEMVSHHLLDSLAIAAPLQRELQTAGKTVASARLLDVGSGAGLPGAVLAAVWPALQVVCVDAVAKKKEVPRAPVRLLEALGRLEPVAARPPVSPSLPLLRPELQAKLSPAELQEVASGVAAGRRLFQIEFLPSTTRASQGVTITWVRERIGEVGEIVKIVPRSMKQSVAAPGGLAFDLLVLTDATAQRLAEVAKLRAEEVMAIGPGPPAVEASPPAAEPMISTEPPVPALLGRSSVSPSTTRIRAGSISSFSATSWRNTVSWPWPADTSARRGSRPASS